MTSLKNLLLLLLSNLFIWGCGSTPSVKVERDVVYEHTLSIKHADQQYRGIAVLKPTSDTKIRIKNTRGGDLDYILVESRHRDDFFEDEGGSWTYHLKWSPERESGLVKIRGFDMEGNHSYGALVLTDGTQRLRGDLFCNGEEYRAKTAWACESKVGLSQYISFFEDVFLTQAEMDPNCSVKAPEIFRELEFELGKGWCIYTFTSLRTGEEYKLWTHGYEMHMIPGGK